MECVCVRRWQTKAAISPSTAPNDAIIAHNLAMRYKPRYTHILPTHTHIGTLHCFGFDLSDQKARLVCIHVCMCGCPSFMCVCIIVMQQLNAMCRENCTQKGLEFSLIFQCTFH